MRDAHPAPVSSHMAALPPFVCVCVCACACACARVYVGVGVCIRYELQLSGRLQSHHSQSLPDVYAQ